MLSLLETDTLLLPGGSSLKMKIRRFECRIGWRSGRRSIPLPVYVVLGGVIIIALYLQNLLGLVV